MMADELPDSQPEAPPSPVVGLAAVFVTLLASAAALSLLVGVAMPMAIVIASALAAVVARLAARRLVAPLVLLALLTWAGVNSDVDPLSLWRHRQKAVEHVFGKSLSDDESATVRMQAEDLVSMRFRWDAEQEVTRRLGLEKGESRPEDFTALVDQEVDRARAETTIADWNRRVDAEYERLARDRRGGYFPPETSQRKIIGVDEQSWRNSYIHAILETIAIAVWGTFIAVVLAVPASVLSSGRTLRILAPGDGWLYRLLHRLGVLLGRRGFDVCRGFNEFVLALIFVAILGLGPFAGVLALGVHTFGVLGKVFSDAIEGIRTGEIEGVAATGAGPAHTVSFAVMPQIMPILVSQSLLRFESNVRSASVLGLVGAGGIGFLIDAKLKSYQFREVATMMILIIIAVSLIDIACSRIMKRFI